MKQFSGQMGLVAAVVLQFSSVFGLCAGTTDPVDQDHRKSLLPDASSTLSLAFVKPERRLNPPMTVWLAEDFRAPTLKDHIDLLVLQRERLTMPPVGMAVDPESVALAPAIEISVR